MDDRTGNRIQEPHAGKDHSDNINTDREYNDVLLDHKVSSLA